MPSPEAQAALCFALAIGYPARVAPASTGPARAAPGHVNPNTPDGPRPRVSPRDAAVRIDHVGLSAATPYTRADMANGLWSRIWRRASEWREIAHLDESWGHHRRRRLDAKSRDLGLGLGIGLGFGSTVCVYFIALRRLIHLYAVGLELGTTLPPSPLTRAPTVSRIWVCTNDSRRTH